MFLKALAPLLETGDMQATIRFYTSMLGFSVLSTFEHEGETTWCTLTRDNALLMFSAPGIQGPPSLTGSLYFNVPDIQAVWERVKDHATIEYAPRAMPYNMHECGIRDNNGYLLRFGSNAQPTTSFQQWFPPSLVLETELVQLRILRAEDVPALQPLTASGTTWKYFTKDLGGQQVYADWMAEALRDYADEKRVPFLVFDKQTGRPAGSTSFGNVSFFDKRIEIGWSWLGDVFKGSGVNTHAKFLLMRYAFETLGFERVEIKTDNLNERSKAALRKIGATAEGVLRSHMQMHSDRRRDSIYFSVLKSEWPQVRAERFGGVG